MVHLKSKLSAILSIFISSQDNEYTLLKAKINLQYLTASGGWRLENLSTKKYFDTKCSKIENHSYLKIWILKLAYS